jgi:hypothetical protein
VFRIKPLRRLHCCPLPVSVGEWLAPAKSAKLALSKSIGRFAAELSGWDNARLGLDTIWWKAPCYDLARWSWLRLAAVPELLYRPRRWEAASRLAPCMHEVDGGRSIAKLLSPTSVVTCACCVRRSVGHKRKYLRVNCPSRPNNGAPHTWRAISRSVISEYETDKAREEIEHSLAVAPQKQLYGHLSKLLRIVTFLH